MHEWRHRGAFRRLGEQFEACCWLRVSAIAGQYTRELRDDYAPLEQRRVAYDPPVSWSRAGRTVPALTTIRLCRDSPGTV
jgi:hypothetical protein